MSSSQTLLLLLLLYNFLAPFACFQPGIIVSASSVAAEYHHPQQPQRHPQHQECFHHLPHVIQGGASVTPTAQKRLQPSTAVTSNTAISTVEYGSTAAATRASEWTSLRISISALNIHNSTMCLAVGQVVQSLDGSGAVTCTVDDIVTAALVQKFIEKEVALAILLQEERIRVQATKGPWLVTNMTGTMCSSYEVPTENATEGVTDADLVLYLSVTPSQQNWQMSSAICKVFDDNRPAVGVLNVPGALINAGDKMKLLYMLLHQLTHLLGFSYYFFSLANMVQMVSGIRGKPYSVPVLNSSTVVSAARKLFNCSLLTFIELEDTLTSNDMQYSHWKKRNVANELMADTTNGVQYSALTLAALQDLGYYDVDLSLAAPLQWGGEAGCTFLDIKCLVDSNTEWPQWFCSQNENALRCTNNRRSLGSCRVELNSQAFPTYFQYFSNTEQGGIWSTMDYCPYVSPWSSGSCTQSNTSATWFMTPMNLFSSTSRCLDASYVLPTNSPFTTAYGLCANITCDTAKQSVAIQVLGSSRAVGCTAGEILNLGVLSSSFASGGYVLCPAYDDVCTDINLAKYLGDSAVFIRPTWPLYVTVAILLQNMLLPSFSFFFFWDQHPVLLFMA